MGGGGGRKGLPDGLADFDCDKAKTSTMSLFSRAPSVHGVQCSYV